MGLNKTDISTTILSITATLVLWEVLTVVFNVPGFILPPPSAIFIEGVTRYHLYLYHSWITFYEMVAGFVLAAVVGVLLAVVIVYSRILRNMLYPQIVVLQIVPKVAIAPLLLIWAGYGITSKVLLALLVSFFPIVVNMVTGLVAIEEELLDLCRILQSGRWQEFSKVRLPNALPYLFSSLKVASTLSVIGAVIGEFVGGSEGLGHLIIIANTELRTWMSFVSLFSLSILGFLLSVVGGVCVAILITYSSIVRKGFYPVIVVSQVIPKISIAPLFIVWFGTGTLSSLLLAFLISFFPMTINATMGFNAIDEDIHRMARTFMASRWQIFWKIRMPNALPHIFAGMKISVTLAIIGVIVSEFVASQQGIGYLIKLAGGLLDTPLMMAAITVLSISGLALYAIIAALESWAVYWQPPAETSAGGGG